MSISDDTTRPAAAVSPATTVSSAMPAAAETMKILASPAATDAQKQTSHARRRLKPIRGYFTAGLLHLMLSSVAFVLVIPFLWMILTSLKTSDEVDSPNWIPSRPIVGTDAAGKPIHARNLWEWIKVNYGEVFDAPTLENPQAKGVPFGRYYWNSIFVASWATFLQVCTSAMAAFSFARLKWPGRDKVFLMYLSTMMLPGIVMMIPNFRIMISLHLVDTFAGLIIPAAFSAFGTFLLRQFMLTIPASLDEAAEIDGASKFRLFFDIILPLSRAGIITLTIFTFMGNYGSLFWPLVMLRSQSKYTLPIGLLYFNNSRGSETNLLMAAVTMSVAPMILIFVLLQKQLVKGIQLGAVKG
jgi:ABC-type glycerol-3-phosphate transport system permease component